MTFFLQYGMSENREGWREERTFLDDHLHAGCDRLNTVQGIASDDESAWANARGEIPG